LATTANRRLALMIHATAVAAVALLMVTVWTATMRAYFWPVWVILSTALAVGVHAWIVYVIDRPDGWRGRRITRALALHGGIAALVELFLVGVWIASGRGYFWPVWSLVGLATPVTIHTLVVLSRGTSRAEQQRSSAVQVQEHDLRRIERDLHDGAQARLVALGMNLGMAEQKLDTDPAAAKALVNEARAGVGEALRELRDLVRGVRPPVLADRGLGDAITALVDRQPLPVAVSVDVVPRPPDAVETAAYLVVAEALANTGKHAGGGRIDVHLQRRGTMPVSPACVSGRGREGHLHRVEPHGRADGDPGGAAVRAVIAEDLALLRDGIVRLLRDNGIEVVAAVDHPDALITAVHDHAPDIAIVDIRLPPTFRDEGLRAAIELLADGRGGVGYLLKDRVVDPATFVEAVNRVAAGGTALDPEVVAQLVGRPRRPGALDRLTEREREVLGLMAEGRSNAGIAEALVLSLGAVEKHIASIFTKLDLAPSAADHRRVLAVLAHLEGDA
jgi:DNA-binding NarL/FixJ family response regulator/signal transduction histidine kinase